MPRFIYLLIVAFVLRFILAFIHWHPDLNNHIDWGIRFWQYGPGDFYTQNVWSFGWPNQPPGTIILFAGVRKLYEVIFAFFWWINVNFPPFPSNLMLFFESHLYQALLKLPAIFADLGIAYLIFRFFVQRKQKEIGISAAITFLVNPITWYNSSIWGQTDSTVNFFGFLALLLLAQKRLIYSVIFLSISLFIKASLLIFVPILLVIALRQKYPLKKWLQAVLITVGLIMLLTIPFAFGEPFSWLFNLYKDKVFGWQLHLITANAFNFWAALTGIHERPDTLMFGPLTYNHWGYILFFATMIPVFLRLYRDQSSRNILWSGAIVAFSSFIFLTGMHERYLYPLFPILTVLVARYRNLLVGYAVISFVYLLNLYNFWWYPWNETLIAILSASDRLLPRIFGGIMTAIFILLYIHFLKQRSSSNI